jgi:hypothetical protein
LTDFQCQTFHEKISKQEINPILIGGLFDALRSLFAEIIEDNFRLIDIGFLSYRITGLVFENLFYLGIFQLNMGDLPLSENIYFAYLGEIAEAFTARYSSILEDVNDYNIIEFDIFTAKLVKMGYSLSLQDCRDCLTRCKDENKGCLPHLYYYKDVGTSSN